MDISNYVKRAADGSVDQDATIAHFTADLTKFIAETAEQESNIAWAVSTVFDANKGQRITMPALTAAAANHLNVQPANWQSLTDKIAKFVRSNTKEYSITKGKNGGVGRQSDLPAKAE